MVKYLERVTAIRLSVNHLHDIFVDQLSRLITIAPIISSSGSVFADKEVLRVVYVLVWACLYAVDDARF